MRVIVGALVAAIAVPATANVLCTKKSGAVVMRTACKKKEVPLDISQFGAVGPTGPAGPFADMLPAGKTVRGTYFFSNDATGAGQVAAANIWYGFRLAATPTVHLIAPASPPPAGCSGTPIVPGADPGHVCIFETYLGSVTGISVVSDAYIDTTVGVGLFSLASGAGRNESSGTWAATGS